LYHLPHISTLSAASSLPTSIQDYSSKHNPRQSQPTEEHIPHSPSNLANEKEYDPWTLHSFYTYKHLLTTMTRRFRILSMVSTFPRAVDQANKVTLNEALVCQTLFQGKQKPSLQLMTLQKDLTPNNHLLEGTHHSLSPPSRLTLPKYSTRKSEVKTSTSQS